MGALSIKAALKGSSIITPDESFLVLTYDTSRNCVYEVIPDGPKPTSPQEDV